MPFVIAGVVVLHIWALHMVGQNNPTGVEPKTEKDTVAFTPYATVKDAFFVGVFCIVFAWFVFYVPNYLGHTDNYIPANPGQTPTHIVPEWYYLPFYAILRAIPNKLLGVIALAASIVLLAFLPWLDTSRVRSANYRPLYRQFLFVFFLVVIGLGYLGSQPPEGGYVIAARILTCLLFRVPARHPAAARTVRDNEAAAELDLGIGAARRPSGRRVGAAATPGAKGEEAGHERSSRYRSSPARWRRFSRRRVRARRRPGSGSAAAGNIGRSAGPFGLYDTAQLQRGFKIYREVCSDLPQPEAGGVPQSCRSRRPGLHRSAGRDGRRRVPGHRRPERQGRDVPATGQDLPIISRRRFANDQAARAALGGKLPPDMSVLAKARGYERGFPWFIFDAFTQYQEDGPDYIHAILNGYDGPRRPASRCRRAAQYNKYFPGHAIGMPKPLSDGQVEYTDGTPTTVDQYGRDVAAFLMWAAEPTLDARKRLGFQVLMFLIVLTALLYFTKQRVWHAVHHHP